MIIPKEDVFGVCKAGQGADTCIWVTASAKGFECNYHERPQCILNAWPNMTAQRDGCEREKAK